MMAHRNRIALAFILLLPGAASAAPQLAFHEMDHYAWSESYRVALVEHGKDIPLAIETLDAHDRVILADDSTVQSSDAPNYDAKTGLLTFGSRVGPYDFIDQTYRLDAAKRRLVLLTQERSSLDDATGEVHVTQRWHRPAKAGTP